MKRSWTRALALTSVIAPLYVACVDDNLINNASFDLWCGDKLCSWSTDEGEIERVATWHKEDYAVSFEETPTQISQLSEAAPVDCIRFDMIADVDPKARVSLKLDFNDDGVIDFEQEVPSVRWKSVQFVVFAPADYVNVRYILRKSGSGRAILAQVRAVSELECSGERIKLVDNAACSLDEVCESGACIEGRCSPCGRAGCDEGSACTRDAHCSEGACTGGICDVCGSEASCLGDAPCDFDSECKSGGCVVDPSPSSANAPEQRIACGSDNECGAGDTCNEGACYWTAKLLGKTCAECASDSDCLTGICLAGQCEACRSHDDCVGGLVCRYGDTFDAVDRACRSALTEQLPRGALCEADADCAESLACGAAGGQPKRCGIGCESDDTICGEGVCARAAVRTTEAFGTIFTEVLPSWSEVAARIATCYERAELGGRCEVEDQCDGSCCDGRCALWLSTGSEEGHCLFSDPDAAKE